MRRHAERGRTARTVKGALIGGAVAGAALGLGSFLLAYLSVHPPRTRPRRTPGDDGLPYEDVVIHSRDHTRLVGWYVANPAARGAIILCHGHPQHRGEMLWWAGMLYPAGYSLLLFDFRALGESGGDLCTVGHHEVDDLLAAADWLCARPEARGLPLGVLGLSMGGATAIQAAARDERFRAVATHGAFATLEHALATRCQMLVGPLAPLLYHPTMWWARRWFPVHPREVSPMAAIAAISPRAVLILHGARDFIMRPHHAEMLHASAREPKALRIYPESWHARVDDTEVEDYRNTLLDFFEAALRPNGDGAAPVE